MAKQALFRALLATIVVTSIGQNSQGGPSLPGQERPLDLSPETIRRAIKQVEQENRIGGHFARVRVYSIDTRDKESCAAFEEYLMTMKPARASEDSPGHLCIENKMEPVRSVVVMETATKYEVQTEIISNLLPSDRGLANDTRNLAVGMGAMLGLLWVLPESISKWDRDAIRNDPEGVFGRYRRNIKKGPVKDNDDPAINYIGHPYAGAATYTLARNNGNSPLQSFGYSIAMSTFFWEYGFEALAEVPSIQDLIITPVIGSIVGEAFYQMESRIRAEGGTVMGSRRLGKISLVLLNPAGAFSNWVNRSIGSTILKNGRVDVVMKRNDTFQGVQNNTLGFNVRFDFYGF